MRNALGSHGWIKVICIFKFIKPDETNGAEHTGLLRILAPIHMEHKTQQRPCSAFQPEMETESLS